jgi:hypothetical protein
VRDRRSRGSHGPRGWPVPARRQTDLDTEQTIVTGTRTARVRQGVRRHGMFETAMGLVLAAIGRLFGCMLLVCLAWDNAQASPNQEIYLEPTRARRLSSEQLAVAASDPDLDLRADFVRDALAHGDACFGVLDDNRVVSYCWFSNRQTEVLPGFTTRFPAGDYYSYKAFTRPSHRGRGLLRDCQVAAAKAFKGDGALRMLTLIERRNVSSLKAFAQAGFHPLGQLVLWRTRWHNRVFHGAGCRQHALLVDAVPPPPVPAAAEAQGRTSPPPADVR